MATDSLNGENSVRNGDDNIVPTEDSVIVEFEFPQDVYDKTVNTFKQLYAIGFFDGQTPPVSILNDWIQKNWACRNVNVSVVSNLTNGFFLFGFETKEMADWVKQQPVWNVFGTYLILQPWTEDFDPEKASQSTGLPTGFSPHVDILAGSTLSSTSSNSSSRLFSRMDCENRTLSSKPLGEYDTANSNSPSSYDAQGCTAEKSNMDSFPKKKFLYSKKYLLELQFAHREEQLKRWNEILSCIGVVASELQDMSNAAENAPRARGRNRNRRQRNRSSVSSKAGESSNEELTSSFLESDEQKQQMEYNLINKEEDYFEDSEEEYSILKPAFVVEGEPDFDSGPPQDGLEYLRRVKWEAAQIPKVKIARIDSRKLSNTQTSYMPNIPSVPSCLEDLLPSREWETEFLADFSALRLKILQIQLPPHLFLKSLPSHKNEALWKKFCFGSIPGERPSCLFKQNETDNKTIQNFDSALPLEKKNETMYISDQDSDSAFSLEKEKEPINDRDYSPSREKECDAGSVFRLNFTQSADELCADDDTMDCYVLSEPCESNENVDSIEVLDEEHSKAAESEENKRGHSNAQKGIADDLMDKCGSSPILSVMLSLDEVSRASLFQYHVSWLENETCLSKERAVWLFALSAVLDKPLDADTCASARALLRKCSLLRASKIENDNEVAMLNILITISSKYFGQGGELDTVK